MGALTTVRSRHARPAAHNAPALQPSWDYPRFGSVGQHKRPQRAQRDKPRRAGGRHAGHEPGLVHEQEYDERGAYLVDLHGHAKPVGLCACGLCLALLCCVWVNALEGFCVVQIGSRLGDRAQLWRVRSVNGTQCEWGRATTCKGKIRRVVCLWGVDDSAHFTNSLVLYWPAEKTIKLHCRNTAVDEGDEASEGVIWAYGKGGRWVAACIALQAEG